MNYSKLSLTKAVQSLIGESQIEALGLPRATEAAAIEWLLSAGAPVSHLLVIREALHDLRESGVFKFQAVEEDVSVDSPENSSITALNATIIRNMMEANTPPENVLGESNAVPTPYRELNLFVRNLITEVQSLSNPFESAAQRSDLVKRLWESDSASALTNEAAREIEEISAELEKAKKASHTAWCQVEAAFLTTQKKLNQVQPYLLRKVGANNPRAHMNGLGYDTYHQVVVIAESDSQARELALGSDGEGNPYITEDAEIWLDPAQVECIDLTTIEKSGVIVVSDTTE